MLVVIATDKDKPAIISQPTVSRGEDILVLYHFVKRERERAMVVLSVVVVVDGDGVSCVDGDGDGVSCVDGDGVSCVVAWSQPDCS